MNRSTWTLALLFLLGSILPAHAVAQAAPDPHVRSTEPELLEALAQGVRQSPTLRHLVEQLEASDVVAYLTFDRHAVPATAGHLSLLAAPRERRYLRICLDRRIIGCQRIGILGHELQHAVEVAESKSVVNEATLAALYRRIGFPSGSGVVRGDCFDSAGAILAGQSVVREMRAAPGVGGTR